MITTHLLYGPPGVGKTTFAERIQNEAGAEFGYISVGKESRNEIAEHTALGIRMDHYLQTVQEYPNTLIRLLVINALARLNKQAVMIDGFPKYPREVNVLEDMLLNERQLQPGIVVKIDAPLEEVSRRIRDRKICLDCGTQSTGSAFCHQCQGGNLAQREDDTELIFRRRYNDYQESQLVVIPLLERLGYNILKLDATMRTPESLVRQVIGELPNFTAVN
jgi:adenylate kinase family enzyme